MTFSSDDIKTLVEFISPLFAACWYLRGALVRLQDAVDTLSKNAEEHEKTVTGKFSDLDMKLADHSKRLRTLEWRKTLGQS